VVFPDAHKFDGFGAQKERPDAALIRFGILERKGDLGGMPLLPPAYNYRLNRELNMLPAEDAAKPEVLSVREGWQVIEHRVAFRSATRNTRYRAQRPILAVIGEFALRLRQRHSPSYPSIHHHQDRT
jgi:hypothetical protein